MATDAATLDRRSTFARRDAHASGALLVNYALALIFLWFGCLKFTQYEAAGIAPLIMNSPFVVWTHGALGIAGASKLIGVYEVLTGLLIAARPVNPKLAVVGGAMATLCFLVTVSFMFTTPGVVQAGFDNPLAISAFPGQFLLKDVVLLAASIAVLLGARAETRSN